MVTYYQKNKERLKEYQREYYYKNREKILEYKKCGTKVEKPKIPKKKDNQEQEYDIISSRVGQMEMLTKWNEELDDNERKFFIAKFNEVYNNWD